ncbi:MAG: hypothetical protein ACK4ND_08570, partial [Cytophagaceae bacterium]
SHQNSYDHQSSIADALQVVGAPQTTEAGYLASVCVLQVVGVPITTEAVNYKELENYHCRFPGL